MQKLEWLNIFWYSISTTLRQNDTITFITSDGWSSYTLFSDGESIPSITSVIINYPESEEDDYTVGYINKKEKENKWSYMNSQWENELYIMSDEDVCIATIKYTCHDNNHRGTYFIYKE